MRELATLIIVAILAMLLCHCAEQERSIDITIAGVEEGATVTGIVTRVYSWATDWFVDLDSEFLKELPVSQEVAKRLVVGQQVTLSQWRNGVFWNMEAIEN